MAENLERDEPAYVVGIACDVLPIIRLARWSAQAGEFLADLHALRQGSPDFDKMCKRMLVGVSTPNTLSNYELLADALWSAENMLESIVDAQGGAV